MKILLVAINAKYIHSNPAIYCLKSYAQKAGIEVDLAEYTINQSSDSILQDLYQKKPDFVGFSCYIWNIEMVRAVITEYRKLEPSVHIWLGGPEVSYDPKQCLQQLSEVDGIMYGEGEETFTELVTRYLEASVPSKASDPDQSRFIRYPIHFDTIHGIAFHDRVSNTIIVTPARNALDFSTHPFLYNGFKDFEHFKNRIIYYESSRGCPYNCSYCLSSIDRHTRFRSLELVKNELSFFMSLQIPQVKFIDRTFNCNKAHANEIWRYIIEHDNGVTNFHFEIKGDLLDEEQLTLLSHARSRLMQFEIGIQTTNQETLQAINRTADFGALKSIVERLRSNQTIHLHLDLIAGLPFEDYNSFINSFNEIYVMQPDQLQLGFLKVLKGSQMHQMASEYGLVYKSAPPYEVMKTNWLSYEDILQLKSVEEMVEVYYNSGQFHESIRFLEHYTPHPYALYEQLAAYYREHQIEKLQHARIKRYEILLEFASLLLVKAEHYETLLKLFCQILTYDLYMRENMKNRPVFASPSGVGRINGMKENSTLHIEHFTYDILASARVGKPVAFDHQIIFDYTDRTQIGAKTCSVVSEQN